MTDDKRRNELPGNTSPLGISRREAAALVGVSVSTFDAMVADGRMPTPKQIGGRKVWSMVQVAKHFHELPQEPTVDFDKDRHKLVW